jgi:hypothetical protein
MERTVKVIYGIYGRDGARRGAIPHPPNFLDLLLLFGHNKGKFLNAEMSPNFGRQAIN